MEDIVAQSAKQPDGTRFTSAGISPPNLLRSWTMHANPAKANLEGLLQIDRYGVSSEQREMTEPIRFQGKVKTRTLDNPEDAAPKTVLLLRHRYSMNSVRLLALSRGSSLVSLPAVILSFFAKGSLSGLVTNTS
jgi:hypothetical protein